MSGFHLKLKLVPAIFSLSERFKTKQKLKIWQKILKSI